MPTINEWFGNVDRLSYNYIDQTPSNGVDTNYARTALGEGYASWIYGFQPIGDHVLKTIPAVKELNYVIDDGVIASKPYAFSIGGVEYLSVASSTGKIYIFYKSSATLVTSIKYIWLTNVSFTLWQGKHLLILCPSALIVWNGNCFTLPSGISPLFVVTNSGSYAATQPTITFSSGAATAIAVMSPVSATTSVAGTGYVEGDIVSASGGTLLLSSNVPTFIVTAVGGGGAVSSVVVQSTGQYTTIPASSTPTSGGSGTGLKLSITYNVSDVQLTNGSLGYTSVPTLTFSSGTAAATCKIMPTGIYGNGFDVLNNLLWIIKDRVLLWSVAYDYTDYSIANGGGLDVSLDPRLHVGYKAIIATLNYIYVFGDDLIYVIAGLTPNAQGTALVPSWQAISYSGGTLYKDSLVVIDDTIAFANDDGIYSIQGSNISKISAPLNGFYRQISSTNGIMDLHPSSAKFRLNNQYCAAWLFRILDGVTKSILVMYSNGIWFFDYQNESLKYITSDNSGQAKGALGITDTVIYQLFSDNTIQREREIRMPLTPISSIMFNKRVDYIGLALSDYSQMQDDYIDVYLDTQYRSDQERLPDITNIFHFISDLGKEFSWLSSITAFDFSFPKYTLWKYAQQWGLFIGTTLKTNISEATITHIVLDAYLEAAQVS